MKDFSRHAFCRCLRCGSTCARARATPGGRNWAANGKEASPGNLVCRRHVGEGKPSPMIDYLCIVRSCRYSSLRVPCLRQTALVEHRLCCLRRTSNDTYLLYIVVETQVARMQPAHCDSCNAKKGLQNAWKCSTLTFHVIVSSSSCLHDSRLFIPR